MSQLRAAALRYAALGFAVFPVHGIVDGRCTCGHDDAWHEANKRKMGKHPATRRGLLDATTNAAVVAGWWNRQPNYNIGIATGPRSGIWVLDEDGPEAAAGVQALEARHGALPTSPQQRTGRGRHVLFRWDKAGPEIKNSAGRIGPGIDVRGAGGFIIVPPSRHASGRTYAWADGCRPDQIPLAEAPAWIVELAAPKKVEVLSPTDLKPRQPIAGRATPYGEAAITNACRELETARKGTQNTTLWNKALAMGSLYAGGEIAEAGYAIDALRRSGRIMVGGNGGKWSDREEDTLTRGFREGQESPRQAPERQRSAPAQPRSGPAPAAHSAAATPAEAAQAALDAGQLWAQARGADCGAFRTWLKVRGLEPQGLPEALQRLRAHDRAPLGGGRFGPALLAPLHGPDEAGDPQALAVLPLIPPAERFTHFLGERAGRALVLSWPEGVDQVLVAIDLQDAWALGQAAFESEDPMAVVVAPSLSAFAGQPLGDRYGRVMFDMPRLDPQRPPWTRAGGVRLAYLAVRGDLRSPELAQRRQRGGTERRRLEGVEAADFWGGMAAQAWRAAIERDAAASNQTAPANPVRLLAPKAGRFGFNENRKEHSGEAA